MADDGSNCGAIRHPGERPPVRLAWSGPVASVVLDRAGRHNALDVGAWHALERAADEVEARPARVLVLRGEGDSFSSGSDLRELARADRAAVERTFLLMERVISRFERLAVPSIAVLRGYALGSSLVLACACDLRVVAGELQAGMPIGRLGIALGEGFLRRLSVLLGPARTKDLIFTGRLLSAREALAWGLAEYDLPERGVPALTDTIARMYPSAVHAAKASLMPPPTGEQAYRITDEAAFREGLERFLARRDRHPRSGGSERRPAPGG